MLGWLKNLFGSRNKPVEEVDESTEWVPENSRLSPEELCGINPTTMTRDEVRKHLAILYRRHNSAVSSLNPDLRAEAAIMLDAIVECRERYVDEA